MRRVGGVSVVVAGAAGLALLALAVVYFTVACQSLPGFMGPHAGDTAPRTGLGILALVLGFVAFAVAFLSARRRRS